jgi:hypothetical protein
MVFTVEQVIFIGMVYFRTGILMLLTVGNIPRSKDDTLHQFQQMFPEPVGTLGGAVARYLSRV